MKINVHAGHNPDGKVACGAVKLIKESTEARKVKDEVIKLLKADGHTVYDCTCNDGTSASNVLTKIVKKCNAHDVDLDVSIHFNAGRNDLKGDNSIGGTEVLVHKTGGNAAKYAADIAKSISELGFRNRGVKVRKDLYFLNSTKAEAVLIECCFVDDKDDIELYDATKMAQAIVKGITNKVVQTKSENVTEKTQTSPDSFKVRINVSTLNIRKGPGVNYAICGVVKSKEVYTIVKTDGKWGRLKSGAGWINLSYTIKL